MTLEDIAIGYAIQTNNLRINKKKITEAESVMIKGRYDYNKILDLGRFRDAYYLYDEDDSGFVPIVWKGWVNCLLDSGMDFTDQEMILAQLLDEKRKYIQERAKYKRALYQAGNKIIKEII